MLFSTFFHARILGIKNHATFENLLVFSFFVLGFIGVINHEMWRDELQAWLIARDSASIPNLLENLKYEGHPALWHLLLYGLSRFTRNPIAMQMFHLLIATGAIYIFINYSPFTKLQKSLFAFSYFPFYEYSIISRNYGIGVLFIFLFCALFPYRSKSYMPLAITLALLANTNAFSLIIVLALISTLIFELFVENVFPKKIDVLASAIIVALGIIAAVLQIIRPLGVTFEINVGSGGEEIVRSAIAGIDLRRFREALASICKGYLPIPNVFEYNFWTTNVFFDQSVFAQENVSIARVIGRIFSYFLSLVILNISLLIFINKPVALFLYSSGTFGILLLIYLTFIGYVRHWGYLFILFLACLWISKYVSINRFKQLPNWANNFSRQYKNKFLTLLLSIHLFVGVFAYQMDLVFPFSVGKEASKYIKENQLEKLSIVGREAFKVSTIAGFIDQKIYYPEMGEYGSFTRWEKLKHISNKKLLEEVANKFNNSKVLLIITEELTSQNSQLKIKKLTQFEGGIIGNENYYLYLVEKKLD